MSSTLKQREKPKLRQLLSDIQTPTCCPELTVLLACPPCRSSSPFFYRLLLWYLHHRCCSCPFATDSNHDICIIVASTFTFQGCPRQHGYFAHPDETVNQDFHIWTVYSFMKTVHWHKIWKQLFFWQICDKFNFCVDGHPNTITCPGGLIFDPVKGQCAYSDQTNRWSYQSWGESLI